MTFKKFRILIICISGFFMLAPAAVYAGADSGIYIGAGVGDAPIKIANFNESDFAYKIFGGYNFGYIPLVDLAVEASYVDFGNPTSNIADLNVSGFDAFGLVGLSFGPFGIFAKAGLINWDAKVLIDSVRLNDDGVDPAYGIGARLKFGSFAVRAEYELFDIDNVRKVSMLSASLVYTF
ncbi:MAG: porin family protein [Proteobacteria bacterium]|nr:porin family protein [Pseudomonadota bacterium]